MVAFPHLHLKNLGSIRCLHDVVFDRSTRSGADGGALTMWEEWFVPEQFLRPLELTIAVSGSREHQTRLYLTDQRILFLTAKWPWDGEDSRPQELDVKEYRWQDIAAITKRGRHRFALEFTGGASIEVEDRARMGVKILVKRAARALEHVRAGRDVTAAWGDITGLSPREVNLQLEALNYLVARDGLGDMTTVSHVLYKLEPGEVPLALQSWERGLALEYRDNVDQLLKEGKRFWALTDRRLLILQGDVSFHVRGEIPAEEILGARLGEPKGRRTDVLLTVKGEIPFPDSPLRDKPSRDDANFAAAVNRAVELLRQG